MENPEPILWAFGDTASADESKGSTEKMLTEKEGFKLATNRADEAHVWVYIESGAFDLDNYEKNKKKSNKICVLVVDEPPEPKLDDVCTAGELVKTINALLTKRYYQIRMIQTSLDTRDYFNRHGIYGPVDLAVSAIKLNTEDLDSGITFGMRQTKNFVISCASVDSVGLAGLFNGVGVNSDPTGKTVVWVNELNPTDRTPPLQGATNRIIYVVYQPPAELTPIVDRNTVVVYSNSQKPTKHSPDQLKELANLIRIGFDLLNVALAQSFAARSMENNDNPKELIRVLQETITNLKLN